MVRACGSVFSRSRTSLTARFKLGLREHDAVEIGGRWYADDWGIGAGTLDLRYGLSLDGGRLLLEPRYRLHVQGEADYYQEEWSGDLPEYRTSDPDLGDFNGHLLGLKAHFIDRRLFGLDADWDVAARHASSACVQPASRRASRTTSPIRIASE